MKIQQHKIKRYQYKLIAVIFWVACWQLLSMRIDNVIFLPSPIQTIDNLLQLGQTLDFWKTVSNSVLRIGGGFFLAVILGSLLVLIAKRFTVLNEILMLGMQLIKSIPVAAFIILALLWIRSKNLSVLISFLMVLPMIYTSLLKGIESTDPKLLEMAKVFRLSPMRKLRYIYLPAILPYFISACSVGLGFCWKSGIAAEVISMAQYSIGGRLYEAKLYIDTEEVFAWIIVIVCISIFFEKLVMYLIQRASMIITKVKPEV
jgi:NitT/TauT family transport system permease protein